MRRIRLVGAFGHYRSGTREALIAVSLEDDLEKLADAIGADWPDIAVAGQFDRAIGDLYRLHLRFPPAWSQEDCDDFIAENAEMAATRLTTDLDDLIDTVVDGYERHHGIRPHNDDARDMIDAARRSAIHELEFDIEALSDQLARMATHSLGRAVASMTGCSPAGRRSQSQNRKPRHRRRRRC
jgi:hypothetical protein